VLLEQRAQRFQVELATLVEDGRELADPSATPHQAPKPADLTEEVDGLLLRFRQE
jgi:hypothetical protein